jgi:hypothetical protein
MATISATWAALDWPVVSALLGATTLFLVWYVQIFRPWRRRRQLKRPFDAHFLITANGQFPLDYVQQNNREHYVKKLVVPPNREIPVQIVLVPKLSFMQRELYFGCDESLMDERLRRLTAPSPSGGLPVCTGPDLEKWKRSRDRNQISSASLSLWTKPDFRKEISKR